MRQEMATLDVSEMPTPEESEQWYVSLYRARLQRSSSVLSRQLVFDHLFQLLTPHFLYLFPSVRMAVASNIPLANIPDADHLDQPVWQFLATVALHASVEQQQILVASLRERVLENVASANKGWVADEEQRRVKLANVNIFLHALGLDSSQISI